MKKVIILALYLGSALAFGQTSKTPAKTSQTQTAAKQAKPIAAPTAAQLVTGDEVDSFLKHMFGFQPGLTWKIADIAPAPEAPGVTRVVVQFGDQMQPFYVLPGGNYAMAGEMIPFGADPFRPVRSKL